MLLSQDRVKHLSQIYQFTILSFLITLQFTAALLSRNHQTRNSLSWLVNYRYATLIQTVYWLIFTPLHYKTHLRWTCQSSVSNMILFFLRFWINMLLYVKESSLLGLFPVGTVRKSRSRKLSVVGLKGNGVVPDSLPTTKYQSYTDQRTVVKNTIFKSKMDYYSSLIYSAESDSKTLFAQLLVFSTGKQINFSLRTPLQLISPINASTFLRRKSSISEVILVHL